MLINVSIVSAFVCLYCVYVCVCACVFIEKPDQQRQGGTEIIIHELIAERERYTKEEREST